MAKVTEGTESLFSALTFAELKLHRLIRTCFFVDCPVDDGCLLIVLRLRVVLLFHTPVED